MTDNPSAPTSSLAPRVASLIASVALMPLVFAQSPQTLQAAYDGAFLVGTAVNEAIVHAEVMATFAVNRNRGHLS